MVSSSTWFIIFNSIHFSTLLQFFRTIDLTFIYPGNEKAQYSHVWQTVADEFNFPPNVVMGKVLASNAVTVSYQWFPFIILLLLTSIIIALVIKHHLTTQLSSVVGLLSLE